MIKKNRTFDYKYDGKNILSGVFVRAKIGNGFLESTEYENVGIARESVSDIFGNGEKYTVSYTGLPNKPTIRQVYYFYPDREYFLTEVFLSLIHI